MKLLETELWITICRPIGNKLQSKTLFLAIFGLYLSIVKSVFDCRLSGVFHRREESTLRRLATSNALNRYTTTTTCILPQFPSAIMSYISIG